MQKNPNQRAFEQFQKQTQEMRQRQMQAAAIAQQQAAGVAPAQRSGCARAISFTFTLLLGGAVLLVVCGGVGYFAAGLATQSEETAAIGALAGGLLGLVLAFRAAAQASRR